MQKVEARKQEIAEAGAGATGIEPETAIKIDSCCFCLCGYFNK
jgi:hypothetical protein